jgi:hypothetical protein
VPKNDLLPIRREAPSTKTNILANEGAAVTHTSGSRPAVIVMSQGNTVHRGLATAQVSITECNLG